MNQRPNLIHYLLHGVMLATLGIVLIGLIVHFALRHREGRYHPEIATVVDRQLVHPGTYKHWADTNPSESPDEQGFYTFHGFRYYLSFQCDHTTLFMIGSGPVYSNIWENSKIGHRVKIWHWDINRSANMFEPNHSAIHPSKGVLTLYHPVYAGRFP